MTHKISATLPALGAYTIPFHKESAKLLNHFTDKELNRLSKIAHLGTATAVFTGVSHSRLEYMLLQCAIIDLLPKFNLGTEQFAVSSRVKLSGEGKQISSGAELLKVWSILGNLGHAQYTYGVERSLLSHLRRDSTAKRFFLSIINQNDLKRWSRAVIENYRDSEFHWVLAIVKIYQHFPTGSHDKGLFLRTLKDLLLPLDQLSFNSQQNLYKVYRLRNIFAKIRLISIVTLDSYYSHHPVRYQISTVLMDLENLFSDHETEFEKLMIQTASWLASELYMHPDSAASLRHYEIQSSDKFRSHYYKQFESRAKFSDFMRNFMNNGFRQPSKGPLRTFLRISLSDNQQRELFKTQDTYYLRNSLERDITRPRRTRLSILRNPFSKDLYIDLLYDVTNSKPNDIGRFCQGLYKWLTQILENQSDKEFKQFKEAFHREDLNTFLPGLKSNIELTISERLLGDFKHFYKQLIESIIRYLIPEEYSCSVVDYIPSSNMDNPYLIKLDKAPFQIDNILSHIDSVIQENPNHLDADRMQEIKALRYVAKYSRSPLLIACLEGFILRDSQGKHVLEWDGILLEVSPDKTRINVIEAKNKRTDHQNEREAIDQLRKSRDFIKERHPTIKTQRSKIPKLGAKLRICLEL